MNNASCVFIQAKEKSLPFSRFSERFLNAVRNDEFIWKRLLSNEEIWSYGIIRVLFSNGTTLRLLFGFFSQQDDREYQELAATLLTRIDKYY